MNSFQYHFAYFAEIELKIAYMNCLVLLAGQSGLTETDRFKYITLLNTSLNMPDEKMVYFIGFSEHPDSEILAESQKHLSQSEVKIPFILDAMEMLNEKDVHSILSEYYALFSIDSMLADKIHSLITALRHRNLEEVNDVLWYDDRLKTKYFYHLILHYGLEKYFVAPDRDEMSISGRVSGFIQNRLISEIDIESLSGDLFFDNCVFFNEFSLDISETSFNVTLQNCRCINGSIDFFEYLGKIIIKNCIFENIEFSFELEKRASCKIEGCRFIDCRSITPLGDEPQAAVCFICENDKVAIDIKSSLFEFQSANTLEKYGVIVWYPERTPIFHFENNTLQNCKAYLMQT